MVFLATQILAPDAVAEDVAAAVELADDEEPPEPAAAEELELDELPHAARVTTARSITAPADALRNKPIHALDNGFSSRNGCGPQRNPGLSARRLSFVRVRPARARERGESRRPRRTHRRRIDPHVARRLVVETAKLAVERHATPPGQEQAPYQLVANLLGRINEVRLQCRQASPCHCPFPPGSTASHRYRNRNGISRSISSARSRPGSWSSSSCRRARARLATGTLRARQRSRPSVGSLRWGCRTDRCRTCGCRPASRIPRRRRCDARHARRPTASSCSGAAPPRLSDRDHQGDRGTDPPAMARGGDRPGLEVEIETPGAVGPSRGTGRSVGRPAQALGDDTRVILRNAP